MKKKLPLIIIGSILIILVVVFFILFGPQMTDSKGYNESRTPITTTSNGDNCIIMSANVRCIAPEDKNEKGWSVRAQLIKKNIESVNPDIIGFQEVTWVHKGYLDTILSDYDSVITYRDMWVLSEGCPIYYKKDRFTLVDKGSFWLSETPEVMSKSWNAACYRVCSYVILNDLTTNKEIVVFNTHLDHVSDEARINGIQVILDKIHEFGFDSKASVLMGDMNSYAGSVTYNSWTSVFDDAAIVSADSNSVELSKPTYQAWGKALDNDRIDFFAVSKTGLEVNSYKVIDNTYDTEKYTDVYPSDHYPIVINITLK